MYRKTASGVTLALLLGIACLAVSLETCAASNVTSGHLTIPASITGDSEARYVGCTGDGYMLMNLTSLNFTLSTWSRGVYFVQLPPNCLLTNISVVNSQFTTITRQSLDRWTSLGRLLDWRETTFRCYKFAAIYFNWEVVHPDDSNRTNPPYRVLHYDWIYANLTYKKNSSPLPYVECDEIADGIIDRLNYCQPGYAPRLLVLTNSTWKAFPIYDVGKSHSFTLEAGNYKYVIIVPNSWANIVQPLALWKREKGCPAYIATTEWISSAYSGVDMQWKIREFIKDAYNTWQIRYVLLAGGNDVIPVRYAGPDKTDPSQSVWPTDWYYGCLDGTWDKNGNGKYGEYSFDTIANFDDDSWFPDAIVGRLPASNPLELETMVSKILSYEQSPQEGAWNRNMLIIAGFDWQENKSMSSEPEYTLAKAQSGNWFPSDLNLVKLYHGNTPADQGNVSEADVKRYFEEGASIVLVDAHGSSNSWWIDYNLSLDSSFVSNLKNGAKLPVVVAESCSNVAIDAETSIAKDFLVNSQGGSVAYIGGTWLTGPLWSLGFWQFLFSRAHERYGLALVYRDFDHFVAGATYDENWEWELEHVLLGDPETAIWYGSPENVSVQCCSSSVEIGANATIEVVDRNSDKPLKDITLRILGENGYFKEVITDEEGKVAIAMPSNPGSYQFQIYALCGNQPTNINTTINVVPTALSDFSSCKSIVGGGFALPMNFTVLNLGDAANISVTGYANVTTIGTRTVFLPNGASATLMFIWNTTAFPYGNYTISASVNENCSCTVGNVIVTIPGDINGDFKVNLVDLVLLARAYGSKAGDSNWNSNADIDGNGVVGLSDLVILAQHYGQHLP